jgi:RNA polymerase sigma-70 factor (ECF subfamily)
MQNERSETAANTDTGCDAGAVGESMALNQVQPREAPAAGSQPVGWSERDRLVRMAYRFLWNQADAEDAAHNALMIAQRRGAELRDPARWWSWLCRILVRQCHQTARSRARRRRHFPRLFAARFGSQAEPASEAPIAPGQELKELIRGLLPKLPSRQRDVLVLRHLEDMSFEQIAAVLDIAPTTARVHARAGREHLREMIRQSREELLT